MPDVPVLGHKPTDLPIRLPRLGRPFQGVLEVVGGDPIPTGATVVLQIGVKPTDGDEFVPTHEWPAALVDGDATWNVDPTEADTVPRERGQIGVIGIPADDDVWTEGRVIV